MGLRKNLAPRDLHKRKETTGFSSSSSPLQPVRAHDGHPGHGHDSPRRRLPRRRLPLHHVHHRDGVDGAYAAEGEGEGERDLEEGVVAEGWAAPKRRLC